MRHRWILVWLTLLAGTAVMAQVVLAVVGAPGVDRFPPAIPQLVVTLLLLGATLRIMHKTRWEALLILFTAFTVLLSTYAVAFVASSREPSKAWIMCLESARFEYPPPDAPESDITATVDDAWYLTVKFPRNHGSYLTYFSPRSGS